MKSIKHIALGAFLTISAFCAVLYTSCTKDKCKDVTCQNGGTCSDGNCVCPTGVTGTNCETLYRTSYANTYKGTGTDNSGGTYTNFRMVFGVLSSTTDFVTMTLTIQDAAGGAVGVPVMNITLANFTTSGATYTIVSETSAGFTYTGTGSISGTTASMTLNEAPTGGGSSTIYTFNGFVKQ
jgi:hypothetical protein